MFVMFDAQRKRPCQIHLSSHAAHVYICCRYDADKQELVSHEIGVAYRIVAGIPRLIPTAGRLVDTATSGRNE